MLALSGSAVVSLVHPTQDEITHCVDLNRK